MGKKLQDVVTGAVLFGLLETARALRREVTAARGTDAWEAEFRSRIEHHLKNTHTVGVGIDNEVPVYNTVLSAIGLVFARDEGDPGAGAEGH